MPRFGDDEDHDDDDEKDLEDEQNEDDDDFEEDEDDDEDDDDYESRRLDDDDCCDFADPGGNSALRRATPSNPRNLPCPTCDEPNRLTPADRALGYCCDTCADKAERGWD